MVREIKDLDNMFGILTGLMTFLVAAILGILFWMTRSTNDFYISLRFTASLVIPYIMMILIWFWQYFQVEEEKIRFKLTSWSILSFLFMYYIELFSILILLRMISNYPTLSALILIGIITLTGYFPYRKIMLMYRAATLNLHFWEKNKLVIDSPYIIGVIITFVIILGTLLLL